MNINVGCLFRYGTQVDTPAIFMVRPSLAADQRIITETWQSEPLAPYRDYTDIYGNLCRRTQLRNGDSMVRYAATVEVPDTIDEIDPSAEQTPVNELPDDVLLFTMASRYCLSDALGNRAWELFGGIPPGWARAQAIVDFVHNHVRFSYGTSTPLTTALDVHDNAVGVCRDFAHLAITFARAMNIPARYVFGYLPDIDVPVADAPMDFCAWSEFYLGGRWWTFDPRNNQRRKGRVLIARGRDALDVAMVTTYGQVVLQDMTVDADLAS